MSNYSVKITKCGKCQFSYDHLPAKLSGCEEVGAGRVSERDGTLPSPGLAWPPEKGRILLGSIPPRRGGEPGAGGGGGVSQPAVDVGRRQIDDRQTDRQTTERER